jgi:SAM-dependent methyltransferase
MVTSVDRSSQGYGFTVKQGKFRILDAFCGLGGAAMGYKRAGWYVLGVDIKPQPDYCGDEFIQADAIKWMIKNRRRFDAVHASPPCQAHSLLTMGNRARGLFDNHQDLIPATRRALERTGKLWVMENVPQAPMRADLELCGLMFDLNLFRHRIFELHGFSVPQPEHVPHGDRRVKAWRHGKLRDGDIMGVYGSGGMKGDLKNWQDAMGIHWSRSWHGLSEAIPPAYTELIGRELLRELSARRA